MAGKIEEIITIVETPRRGVSTFLIKKPRYTYTGAEILIVSANENPPVVWIPLIVRIAIVRVEPGLAVLVPIHVEDFQIAVGVRYV